MLEQLLRYDALLILIGRKEEENFALRVENDNLKRELTELREKLANPVPLKPEVVKGGQDA